MDLYNNINVTTKEFTKKCNLIVFCNIINNAKVLKKTKKICYTNKVLNEINKNNYVTSIKRLNRAAGSFASSSRNCMRRSCAGV